MTETTQGNGDYTLSTDMNDSFYANHGNINYYHRTFTKQKPSFGYHQVWTDIHHKNDFTFKLKEANQISEGNSRTHVMYTQIDGSVRFTERDWDTNVVI